MTPERAFEMVAKVIEVHTKMVTARLFDGDQDLHRDFVQWAIKHEREAYVRASEAMARTQSSKPLRALLQKRIASVRKENPEVTAKAKTEAKNPQQSEYEREIEATRRRLRAAEEAHREERRLLAQAERDLHL